MKLEPMQMVLGLVAAGAVGGLGYLAWWHIKYKTVYSEVKTTTGVVTDMDYTPPRTQFHSNGKTSYTTTTPAKNEVYISFEVIGNQHFNSSNLYQRVRIDEEVTAEYREIYRVERERPTRKELTGYDVLSVTNPKGRRVEF